MTSATDCYEPVLAQAGATYPYRDAIDARVVAETRTDSGRYVNTEDEVGGYPAKDLYGLLHLIQIWTEFRIHGKRHMA